jgi:pimeloyl-ACP methyl ester carboxylesterase
MRVSVADGVSLYVHDWGQGRPVVLLHGWPSNHRIFEYHMMMLADAGFHALAIDLRGFGDSDKPWHGNDYDTWASDVGAVLAALDLRDVLLAGYSMGGAIASLYASRRDPRVTQLALFAAAAPEAAPRAEMKAAYDTLARNLLDDPAQLNTFYARGVFHAPISHAMLQVLIDIALQASLWSSLRGLYELRDRDLSDAQRAITVPTLLCHGIFDNTIPYPLGEAQARLIPRAQLVPFRHSGHALIFEEKRKLVDTLIAFARGEEVKKAA